MSYKGSDLEESMPLSNAMLECAEEGDWDKVFSLESKRNQTLKKIFSKSFTVEEKKENEIIIRLLLKINKELETIAGKAREVAMGDMNSVNKGRHAVGMYAQNMA